MQGLGTPEGQIVTSFGIFIRARDLAFGSLVLF
jgi:hypothetical protein